MSYYKVLLNLNHSNLGNYSLQLVNIIFVRARRRGETRSSDYVAGKVRGSIDRRRMVAIHFGQDPNGGFLAELDEVTIWER